MLRTWRNAIASAMEAENDLLKKKKKRQVSLSNCSNVPSEHLDPGFICKKDKIQFYLVNTF